MKLKKKDICLYILYLLICLLIALIIYYTYKIFTTKKKYIEPFQNSIEYLTSQMVSDFLNRDYDNYVNNLSRFDLIARKVDTNNQYIQQISNCAKDFTETQKNIINNCCKKADEFLQQYNHLLDGKEIAKLNWKFALTDKQNGLEYEDGLPHTRSDIIFFSDKMIPETETPDLVNTLIHEKIHVYQRQHESDVDVILSNSDKLGFHKIVHFNPKKRANPDLNNNTYKNPNNELMQCYYNSDNPNSIQDVTCLHNNSVNEHPYEFLAYTIANKYNDYLIKKYINI